MPKMPVPAQETAFQSLRADIGGMRLHYHVGGDPDGPPVLLWHGFLSTSQVWRKVMPLLADAGYAVLAPTCAATAIRTNRPALRATTPER